MDEEKILEERKKKIIKFLKDKNYWVIGFLILIIILGVYIRTLPMHIRPQTGKPGLWDFTTNDWTLGPDLDPWLFTRYAKTIIEEGSLPRMDMMRNVPLGFDTTMELQLLTYSIIGTYHFVNLFGNYSVNFAAVFMPVIFFLLTIISFFLFVREIFVRKDNKKSRLKANSIALISSLIMIVTPVFLSRTVAGIPEKEAIGFFFMFLSFYLFLKAWKSDKLKAYLIFGILAGVSTALMAFSWGGVIYIYTSIAISCLVALVLNKINKKEFIIYSFWFWVSGAVFLTISNRATLKGFLTSLDSGLAFFVFFILLINLILKDEKIYKKLSLNKIKLPKNIVSIVFGVLLIIVLSIIFLGPSFIFEKIQVVNQVMFNPITGRWNITVAENRQPFFGEWVGSFGPFIENIPVLFWLFFIGSLVLFKKMLVNLKKKDAWVLTGLYVLFFLGLVFSRYSPSSILNGTNFISKFIYYSTSLLLAGSLIYYYSKYNKEKHEGFEKINYEYLFLFSLLAIVLFTVRGAVRLIMVLGPIAPIFLGFLIVELSDKFLKSKKESSSKIFFGLCAVIVISLGIFTFWSYYQTIKVHSYNFVPSHYNQQWQNAMFWVRENTPEDAVFAHWWDYGYWVQSIGNRATVTDGGNAIPYWNYLTGRYVLTGDNQKDSLDFLYSHDADYLLIDSTDLGKYGAFSSIGSNEDYDRLSYGPVSFISEQRQITETANSTIRIYQMPSGENTVAVYPLDEDIVYEKDGNRIFLPSGRAGIIGVRISYQQNENGISFKQAEGIFVYNNQQHIIPIRYVYFNGNIIDFKEGLEATVYLIDRIIPVNQGAQIDNIGAVMYISPRLMRGFLAQVYILNNALDNFPNFKLAHSENNMIINSLNMNQRANIGEFAYFQGIQGPIKIWEIQYTGEEEIKEEYLDRDYSKYISWKL